MAIRTIKIPFDADTTELLTNVFKALGLKWRVKSVIIDNDERTIQVTD